jgi:hypothetical protein
VPRGSKGAYHCRHIKRMELDSIVLGQGKVDIARKE